MCRGRSREKFNRSGERKHEEDFRCQMPRKAAWTMNNEKNLHLEKSPQPLFQDRLFRVSDVAFEPPLNFLDRKGMSD